VAGELAEYTGQSDRTFRWDCPETRSSSLYYRLREAPLVHENVLKLLKELCSTLAESTCHTSSFPYRLPNLYPLSILSYLGRGCHTTWSLDLILVMRKATLLVIAVVFPKVVRAAMTAPRLLQNSNSVLLRLWILSTICISCLDPSGRQLCNCEEETGVATL
jgi:hypothetical protein